MIATISSEVATGRRMKGRDGFMVGSVPAGVAAAGVAGPSMAPPDCTGAGARRRWRPVRRGRSAAAGACGGRGGPAFGAAGLRHRPPQRGCRRHSGAATTLAPSRSLSAPSTTTLSPGDQARTAPRRARRSCGPSVDRLHRDRAVGLDEIDEGAGRAALDRARSGSTVASCSVSTSSRTLTNWLGNRALVVIGELRRASSPCRSWCRSGCRSSTSSPSRELGGAAAVDRP